MIIGNKRKVAFVIGKKEFPLRKVEIYIANKLVTGENNMAYLPSYIYSLECEHDALKERRIKYDWIFLSLDDTTDSFSTRAIVSNNQVIIKMFINNQASIVLTLPIGYLLRVFKRTAKFLRKRV